MMFRQMFDHESSTYTYLLASRPGGEAIVIDPVLDRVPQYAKLLEELDLKLVLAVDTHIHADHVTGLGALRESTDCSTAMGEHSRAECVSVRLKEGEDLNVDGLRFQVLDTQGVSLRSAPQVAQVVRGAIATVSTVRVWRARSKC